MGHDCEDQVGTNRYCLMYTYREKDGKKIA